MVTTTETQRYEIYSGFAPLAGQAAVGGNYIPPRRSGYRLGSDTFTGGENRNWVSDIRAGRNATTDASGVKVQYSGMGPQLYCWGYTNLTDVPANARSVSIWVNGLGTGFPAPESSSPEEIANSNKARARFNARISELYTQFQGGVFLGELRETLSMIRKPAQSLRKRVGQYLDDILQKGRRMKRRSRAERERWVSGSWLEASYGWLPLLSDLDEARSYLKRRQDALLREMHTVLVVQDSGPILRDEVPATFTGTIGTISYSTRSVDTYIHILGGGVRSQALGQGLINASAMGLAPRNFAPTLWELIPWSFAIDYFTNVGDVISGWSNQSVVLSWGRETTVQMRECDIIGQRGVNTVARPKGTIFIPGYQRTRRRSFVRRPIESPPVPGFQFEIPGTGLKWLNLAALAAQRRSVRSLRLWD